MAQPKDNLDAAVARCGRAARLTMRAATAELVIDKFAVMFAVKGIAAGEPSSNPGAEFRVMLRVDAVAAKAAGLPVDRDLDRFIMRHEGALNALLVGADPPFDARGYALRMVLPAETAGDDWVRHLVTRDRYRMSLWELARRSKQCS